MKLIECVSIGLVIVGFLMKLIPIRYAGEVLFIGALTSLLFYWCLGFAALNNIELRAIFKKSSYANVSGGRIVGAIGIGFCLACVAQGLTFKLLILTGATEVLTIGVTSLAMLLFAALVVMIFKRRMPDDFYRGVFIRGGLALLLGITAYMTPSTTLANIYYRNDPEYRDKLIQVLQNPSDKALADEWDEFQERRSKSK